MENNDTKSTELPSSKLDLSSVFLILKHKILFYVATMLIFFSLFTNKVLNQAIIFSTEGIVYVEKEKSFLDMKDVILKKIMPDYDEESRKEFITEYFKNPVVIRNTVVRSGYNVHMSSYKNSEASIPTFLNWKTVYNKNIKNLTAPNKVDDLYVENATIDNENIDKIKLVIKFMDSNEFKVFNSRDSKYLITSKVGEVTQIKDICKFVLSREKKTDDQLYDGISPIIELPEPLYVTITNQELFYDDLKEKITIDKSKSSSMVRVTVEDSNPYILKMFTDILMDEFMNFNINIKIENINSISSFIEKEREDLEGKRNALLKDLANIRTSTGKELSSNFFYFKFKEKEDYKSEEVRLDTQIRKLQSIKDELINEKDITKISVSEGLQQYSTVTKMVGNLLTSIDEFEKAKKEYTSKSIIYIQARDNIYKTKELLILTLTYKIKELNRLKDRISSLHNDAGDDLILSLEIKEKVEFIQNKIKMVDDLYEGLYEKERNILYNRVFIRYSNRILKEGGISNQPINKIGGEIVMSFIKSFVFATIATIIKHLIFPVFLSRIVIGSMTQSKVIGGIPKISKSSISNEGFINFIKEDKIYELFNNLQTLVFFQHDEIKTIQFTSPYPKDGKTFLARNVAQSLASNNAKVILVNMNLDIEKKQKLKKIDSAGDLRKAIKKIKINHGKYLYVLPFNTTEKNMQLDAKLDKYNKILSALKKSFDYIILDTPQYPMYSESLSLSTLADLSVTVVKLNHTPIKISGKHFKDISKYSKKHIILINDDLININSSGYSFIDKKNIKHYIEKLKLKLSQI